MTKVGRYPSDPNPVIQMDPDCAVCGLGRLRQEHNRRAKEREENPQYCVGGHGPEDLSKVKLIVMSDYPGAYEVKYRFPMVDKRDFKPEVERGRVVTRNAGSYLRRALHLMYGLDTYDDCWFTNAVKCSPNNNTVLPKYVKECTSRWLSNEFNLLDQHCPHVPLLVLGTQAYRACCLLFSSYNTEIAKLGYTGVRRRVHLINDRPVVFSFNPAVAARSEPRIETRVKEGSKGMCITGTDWLYPPLPGSPVDRFINDLRCLAEVLNVEH